MTILSTTYISRDWSRPLAPVTLEGNVGAVYSVIELQDGKLASGLYEKTIRIWDRHKQQCVATLEGHTSSVLSVIELKDGKLASGSFDKTIKIWDRHKELCV